MDFTCALISSTFTQFDGSAPHVTMKVVKNSWITTKQSLIGAIACTLILSTILHIAKRGRCDSPHLNRRISQNCFGGGESAMQPELIGDNHKLVSDDMYLYRLNHTGGKIWPRRFSAIDGICSHWQAWSAAQVNRHAWRTLMTMMVIIKLRTISISVAPW